MITVSDNDANHFTGTTESRGKGTAENTSLETTARKLGAWGRCRRDVAC